MPMPMPRNNGNPSVPPTVQLPHSEDAERALLGSILFDNSKMDATAAALEAADFYTDGHRRIFLRMLDLRERGEGIDTVILANALQATGELSAMPGGLGLSYLVSLTQGLPEMPSIEGYIRLIKDKAHLRTLIYCGQRQIDQAQLGIGSPQDIAAAGIEALGKIQRPATGQEGRSAEQIVEEYPGGIGAFLDPSQRPKGLQTGLMRLDEITTGLHPGELIILAARPSVGKSSLMLNIAEHLCLHPKQRRAVSVFSLEMSNADNLTRLLCSSARVDAHKFRAGFLNSEERRRLQVALLDLTQSRLKLYDDCIMMADIERAIEKDVEDNGCALACVDYIGLIGVKKKGERRDLDIADMTRRFKLLAKRLGIPILLLCQLSRAGDKRSGASIKPILSDLRESGSIENDADQVWFIDREELRSRDRTDLKGLAELIIGKNRHGSISVISLLFIGSLMKFCNRYEDTGDSEPEPAYDADD